VFLAVGCLARNAVSLPSVQALGLECRQWLRRLTSRTSTDLHSLNLRSRLPLIKGGWEAGFLPLNYARSAREHQHLGGGAVRPNAGDDSEPTGRLQRFLRRAPTTSAPPRHAAVSVCQPASVAG
jgi:hypothetical protein